jgi:hypothetical protein
MYGMGHFAREAEQSLPRSAIFFWPLEFALSNSVQMPMLCEMMFRLR